MVRPEVKRKRRQMAEQAVKSKKERKKLEKIVLRKKNKVDRNNILVKLKQVQLDPSQLDKLHSTSDMQTQGLKKFTSCDTNAGKQYAYVNFGEADRCQDAMALIKRKKRKIKPSKSNKDASSSSSEDTDSMSTDTELYEHEDTVDGYDTKVSPDIKSLVSKESATDQTDAVEPEKRPESLSNSKPISEPIAHHSPIMKKQQLAKREPAVYVKVDRDPEVEKMRMELPIINEEQNIMEAIRYNDVVIISGETGSGKTTQLPQFLYEAGYTLNGKLIGITEPRRVAAVTMSDRVSHELKLYDGQVAYQIRFSGTVSDKTQIKFMTDGVLLKECQHDFLLTKYSAIIIDEAHERSVFSDILIGLLSRIVPLRAKKGCPLKLIIMSATLRVSDFTENTFLFPKLPPVINIDARQYPVTMKFAMKTPANFLDAAYKKVCSIHNRMPRGGILVFVTSQMDVKALCRRLEKKSMLYCLELYAMLPLEKQQLVFKRPPEGSRLCVIATNVAETSITIPNIRYVVDTGMEKRKHYDLLTGTSRFITTWIPKSSAEQRAGRAGRIGPGTCYRLYSSAVYTNDFAQFSEPQILQKPVEDVLLQMKAMNIDNVVNFPFPSRPSIEALKAAEKKLVLLGALDDTKSKTASYIDIAKTEYASRPTPLGKAMAKFTVSARCSKMIVKAPKELVHHVLCLVSALTVREMFIDGPAFKELRKKWAGHGIRKLLGDYMVMIRAIIEANFIECRSEACLELGLRPKAMLEIDKLRRQLINDINKNPKYNDLKETSKMRKPTDQQCNILRQLLLSSFCDHVARKIPDGEVVEKESHLPGDKCVKKKLKGAYECIETDEPVYISMESTLRGQHPEYVIYKELYKGEKKTYMRDVAMVDANWLPPYVDKLSDYMNRARTILS